MQTVPEEAPITRNHDDETEYRSMPYQPVLLRLAVVVPSLKTG